MTTSNHIYTGAAIAMTIQQPAAAMLLALLSHFALDVLPHYGWAGESPINWFKHKLTWAVEGFNIIGVPLLIYLIWGQPWWVFAAASLAILPDSVWIFRYLYYERYGLTAAKYALTRFHDKIQWGERPWGAIVEALFFVSIAAVIVSQVY